jgi:hypothetical protein
MWSTFSGSKTATAPARPTRAPTQDRGEPSSDMELSGIPWEWEEDSSDCHSAAANLLTALPRRLTLDGVVHAETCLAAIGAIAGLAAQRALFQHLTDLDDKATLKLIRSGKTRTGIEYFSGDPLNRMLVPAPDAKTSGVWPLAATGALKAGLPVQHLPDVGEMFAHVARGLAHDGEGRPSIPDHQPHMTGRETLQIVWPVAMDCFHGRAPDAFPHSPTAIRRWPAIAGFIAGELIQKTAGILHPRTGLIIVMESAIYASKIRPGSVYAPRPVPKPSLSERLEDLSDRMQGGEVPQRRPAGHDPEHRHAERDPGQRAREDLDMAGYDDRPSGITEDALAQQLSRGLREHFM